jgi:hypothetical protein
MRLKPVGKSLRTVTLDDQPRCQRTFLTPGQTKQNLPDRLKTYY